MVFLKLLKGGTVKMKKILSAILTLCLLLVFTIANVGCSKKVNVSSATPKKVNVSSVTLSKNEEYVTLGKTFALMSNISPSNATDKTTSYSSSNKDVAIVDQNGNVTAKAIGTAKITVTTKDGSFISTCDV